MRLVEQSGGTLLVEVARESLAGFAGLPDLTHVAVWGPGNVLNKLDPALRGELLGAFDVGAEDPPPLAIIATFAPGAADVAAAVAACGAACAATTTASPRSTPPPTRPCGSSSCRTSSSWNYRPRCARSRAADTRENDVMLLKRFAFILATLVLLVAAADAATVDPLLRRLQQKSSASAARRS